MAKSSAARKVEDDTQTPARTDSAAKYITGGKPGKAANEDEAPEEMNIDDLVEHIRAQRGRRDRIVEKVGLSHAEAYLNAAKQLLMDEEGEIDLDRLDSPSVQKEFVKLMHEHYIEAAAEYFKLKPGDIKKLKKGDSIKGDMLASAYARITKGQLSEIVGEAASDYSLDAHNAHSAQLKKTLKEELTQTIYSPVKKSHAKAIVKHLGAHEYLVPHSMKEKDVQDVLEQFYTEGTLHPKMFKGKNYLHKDFKPYKQTSGK